MSDHAREESTKSSLPTPPVLQETPGSLTAQVLREIAERIRVACPEQPGLCPCCRDDAAMLDRIAADQPAPTPEHGPFCPSDCACGLGNGPTIAEVSGCLNGEQLAKAHPETPDLPDGELFDQLQAVADWFDQHALVTHSTPWLVKRDIVLAALNKLRRPETPDLQTWVQHKLGCPKALRGGIGSMWAGRIGSDADECLNCGKSKAEHDRGWCPCACGLDAALHGQRPSPDLRALAKAWRETADAIEDPNDLLPNRAGDAETRRRRDIATRLRQCAAELSAYQEGR